MKLFTTFSVTQFYSTSINVSFHLTQRYLFGFSSSCVPMEILTMTDVEAITASALGRGRGGNKLSPLAPTDTLRSASCLGCFDAERRPSGSGVRDRCCFH